MTLLRKLHLVRSDPAAIIPRDDWHPIAGLNIPRYEGGVFNPGALVHQGKIWLLARGEKYSLRDREHSYTKFTKGVDPVFLQTDLGLGNSSPPASLSHPGPLGRKVRFEDYRLFTYRGEVYTNHSVARISLLNQLRPGHHVYQGRFPLSCSIAISQFQDGNRLKFLGEIQLDTAIRKIEKNWGVFEANTELYVLYSISPYRLFRLADWKRLYFKSLFDFPLALPLDPSLNFISLSTNPVTYDDRHLLVVIHQKSKTNVYRHWGMKISRSTLKPVQITEKPLFVGGDCQGLFPNVVFPMACLALDDRIVFTMGEADSSCVHAAIDRDRLEQYFTISL